MTATALILLSTDYVAGVIADLPDGLQDTWATVVQNACKDKTEEEAIDALMVLAKDFEGAPYFKIYTTLEEFIDVYNNNIIDSNESYIIRGKIKSK